MYKVWIVVGMIMVLSILTWQGMKGAMLLTDGKMHLIVCDVGQGDGIIIKSPQGRLIVFDGGPDESIVSCLSEYLPFWHNSLDVLILSHPHADHFAGYIPLLNRYKVEQLWRENLLSDQNVYEVFTSLVRDKKITERVLFLGDRIQVGEMVVRVVGPSQAFIERTSPRGNIGESREFASLILQLTYRDFHALLTGDSQVGGLEEAMQQFNLSDISVLQVPHHGSATGLNEHVVKKLSPNLAFISVGATNRYGHPADAIVSLLQKEGVSVLRTDQKGSIHIVSDGRVTRVVN